MTQVSGKVTTYEDEFPPRLGPPRVENYTGAALMDATQPIYTVELDAGAFRAVWELLEGEARHRFPARTAISGIRAYLRAVETFRSAYWQQNVPPAPEPKVRLVRKKKAG
jgi:hypothetical protein